MPYQLWSLYHFFARLVHALFAVESFLSHGTLAVRSKTRLVIVNHWQYGG